MLLSSPTTVPRIFDHKQPAAQAIRDLKEAEFIDGQNAVASRKWSPKRQTVDGAEQHVGERGAVAGVLVGAGIGAALGLAGALLLSGALPLVAAHALLGVIGGGLAGASGGAFAGPFIALDLSEAEADKLARSVKSAPAVTPTWQASDSVVQPELPAAYPAVNLSEDDDFVYAEALLPGQLPSDLEITITDQRELTIRGEQMQPKGFAKSLWRRRERGIGRFERTVELPVHTVVSHAEAHLDNGVLTLRMPKSPEAKPVKIPVNVE